MPAPIYDLDEIVYSVNTLDLSVKKGKVTKVITDPSNKYRIDFIYPDLGTVIVEEQTVFSRPTDAAAYLFQQTGSYIPSRPAPSIEEGEWYPTLYGETTGVGVQMLLHPTPEQRTSYVLGRYQRVGNMCWLGAYVYTSSKNGATGNVLIGGLPYPPRYTAVGAGVPTSFLVPYSWGITLTPPINLYSVVFPISPTTPKALTINGWETLTQTAQTVTASMCVDGFGIEFSGWYPIEE